MTWILLLQDFLPVSLGPLGTVIAVGVALISAALNIYQYRKSGETESLRGQVGALNGELKITRERSERITEENLVLAKTAGELKAKTDLSQIQRQTQEFEFKNQEVHERIVRSLDLLTKKGSARYEAVIDTISENTRGLYDLGNKIDRIAAQRDEYKMRADVQQIELAMRDKDIKRLKGILDSRGIKLSDFDGV